MHRVPSFLTTIQRLRFMLPGFVAVIRRDAFQATLPDPAVRLISIILRRPDDSTSLMFRPVKSVTSVKSVIFYFTLTPTRVPA